MATPGGFRDRVGSTVRDDLRRGELPLRRGIASAVYLGERLGKPVLVEGPAGTGKTELAKTVAAVTGGG